MMKLRLVSALFLLVLLGAASTFVAHADVGGEVPAPGSCDYPMVGRFGLDGVAVYHYFCSGPTEINGSHWQVVYGGAGGVATAGVSVLFFNANIAANIGVIEGWAYWACPDMSMADEPNPIQTWQGSSTQTAPVKRSKCKTIAPYPAAGMPALPGGSHGA